MIKIAQPPGWDGDDEELRQSHSESVNIQDGGGGKGGNGGLVPLGEYQKQVARKSIPRLVKTEDQRLFKALPGSLIRTRSRLLWH